MRGNLMNRIKVKSSNVVSVGYDETKKILEVEFINSDIYRYFNVSKKIYDSFMSAESKGKFIHKYIRGVYKYVKV